MSEVFHRDLGGGLELHLLQEQHADSLFAAADQNREEMRRWLPWMDRTLSAEDMRSYIRGVAAPLHENREGLEAAIVCDGQAVGAIGLHRIDLIHRHTSIGYWLGAGHQGRGMMTRACRAMVQHGFEDFGLHRIEIRCATENHKSCAVPSRLGFFCEGVLREAQHLPGKGWTDLLLWSMLQQDWMNAESGGGSQAATD